MVLNSLQPKMDKDIGILEAFRIRGEIEEERIEEVLAMDVNTKDFYATTNHGEVVKLTFDQVMVMPPMERRRFINFMNMKSARIVHLTATVATDEDNSGSGSGLHRRGNGNAGSSSSSSSSTAAN